MHLHHKCLHQNLSSNTKNGTEVDKAKIEVIAKLPMLKFINDIRSFLGHTGFYRRFIKDFSKIARRLTNLLAKDMSFTFYSGCLNAWEKLKMSLFSHQLSLHRIGKNRLKSCVMLLILLLSLS